MSLRRTARLVIATATAACLAVSLVTPALAAPSVDQERAALDRALAEYDEAQARSDEIDARVAEVSARLDQAFADEQHCLSRLRSRVVAMYRFGENGTFYLLLGASDIQDLAMRLDLLARMAREDAENLLELKAARAEAERSAQELLTLQAEAARALDEVADEVASARQALAASEAALREYEARVAAAAAAKAAKAKPAAAPVPGDPNQGLTGSGEWRTAVASHYSINFTGRGANGEPIGPYSMIVAHKTLPFGTLIEFEYEGKRAVARVTDRGPFTPGREFDLGPGVARTLGFNGVHEVRYRLISQ
ncbi:MAG: hypothetical protein JXA36_00760 [Coriobacteriia bacterium]|nr:hypothetical protein [Coriobacteriia bacterium]